MKRETRKMLAAWCDEAITGERGLTKVEHELYTISEALLADVVPEEDKPPIVSNAAPLSFGAAMYEAEAAWRADLETKGLAGGELSVGPCVAALVPCGCPDPVECDWCCGSRRVTKRVREARQHAAKRLVADRRFREHAERIGEPDDSMLATSSLPHKVTATEIEAEARAHFGADFDTITWAEARETPASGIAKWPR